MHTQAARARRMDRTAIGRREIRTMRKRASGTMPRRGTTCSLARARVFRSLFSSSSAAAAIHLLHLLLALSFFSKREAPSPLFLRESSFVDSRALQYIVACFPPLFFPVRLLLLALYTSGALCGLAAALLCAYYSRARRDGLCANSFLQRGRGSERTSNSREN